MPPPKEITELIERFDRNREAYLSGDYNETQLRREFIDPFFAALGWDVDNKQGFAEAYKDVIHEDAIKIGGYTKAPDYCFRLGGMRKFFVEAKKPSVNLKDDTSPAFQLRRYAWSAKLPLSILTDFEEFAVYDCRNKPAKTDKPSLGRALYLHYTEYAAHWEELSAIFSKEAVQKGLFDKYAEANKAKKGTAEVDQAFLKEIEAWREMLARNIALRNPNLSQRELNFAVQRTIDRIIFLRICEDRGIETCAALMALQNGERVYRRLCEIFYRADERYNSGLFHFQKEKDRREEPDELTLGLQIDDKPLKEIIKNLYYPDSPYEFSVLPADILGQVYEQFLGKVIRLTSGHRAVVEDKPEVKKAGGVYYTPTYIVDYIVKNTVGKLLEGKTPRPAAQLRLLDPACGSGSFLIGAYQYLLDWHRDWYVNDGPEKNAAGRQPALFQTAKGDWRLTTAARKQILLNNIFGVDIDPQAVEVTKLSLLLKVLEGENEQSISQQLKFFHGRALPDLGNNIKCGNSLIGPDFYAQQQMSLLDNEERYRINSFDWQAEFPEIMKAGGFDAVIGNPPYVLGRETFDNTMKKYLSSNYVAFGGKYDLYIYFTEKAISLLNKQGKFGYILPNTLLANVNAVRLRKLILDKTNIEIIKTFKSKVFDKAQVESIILILQNTQNSNVNTITIEAEQNSSIPQSLFLREQDFRFNVNLTPIAERLIEKIQSLSVSLGTLTDICIGIQLGGSSGDDRKESFLSNNPKDKTYKKVIDGRDINRYQSDWNGAYVHYGDWLHRKRDEKYFLNHKIVIRQIGRAPIATIDEDRLYTLNTIYNLINLSQYSLKYLLGIINSKLGRWFWIKRNYDFKTLFPKIKKTQIEAIPIRIINFSDPADKSRHDRMVDLVEQMLRMHKQLAAAKTDHEKTALQRQIEATDRQIDALVYALYGLTEEEIKIVEGRE